MKHISDERKSDIIKQLKIYFETDGSKYNMFLNKISCKYYSNDIQIQQAVVDIDPISIHEFKTVHKSVLLNAIDLNIRVFSHLDYSLQTEEIIIRFLLSYNSKKAPYLSSFGNTLVPHVKKFMLNKITIFTDEIKGLAKLLDIDLSNCTHYNGIDHTKLDKYYIKFLTKIEQII